MHPEVVGALLAQQSDRELLAGDGHGSGLPSADPGTWIERNRRVVQRYQALVDQEVNGGFPSEASHL